MAGAGCFAFGLMLTIAAIMVALPVTSAASTRAPGLLASLSSSDVAAFRVHGARPGLRMGPLTFVRTLNDHYGLDRGAQRAEGTPPEPTAFLTEEEGVRSGATIQNGGSGDDKAPAGADWDELDAQMALLARFDGPGTGAVPAPAMDPGAAGGEKYISPERDPDSVRVEELSNDIQDYPEIGEQAWAKQMLANHNTKRRWKAGIAPFSPVKLLAKGGMGEVWVVSGPDGRYYAAKHTSVGTAEAFAAEAEAECDVPHALKQVPHVTPHVMDCFEKRFFPELGRGFFLLELVREGTTLENLLRPTGDGSGGDPPATATLGAGAARRVAAQLLLVVEAMSEAGFDLSGRRRRYVHHDLKPLNVIVDPAHDFHLTVIDFGGARECSPEVRPSAFPLTPPYADPAISAAMGGADPRVASHALPCPSFDTFSVGAIYYEVLTGSRFTLDQCLKRYPDITTPLPLPPHDPSALLKYRSQYELTRRVAKEAPLITCVPVTDLSAVHLMTQLDPTLRPPPSFLVQLVRHSGALAASLESNGWGSGPDCIMGTRGTG